MSGSFVTSRTRQMVSSGEAEPVCAPVMIRASAPHSVAIRALSSMEMALLSMNGVLRLDIAQESDVPPRRSSLR